MALEQVSAARAALPDFPGTTLPEKLLAGREIALAILRKYRPGLDFTVDGARASYRAVDAWIERNSAQLEPVLADANASALPDALRANFPATDVQDFVIAGCTLAAAGMGPWVSGAVASNATEAWARGDAEARLRVFGGVVQMEKSGFLADLFASGRGMRGLGLGPGMVVAIAIGVALIAAVICTYLYSIKQLELNNRSMDRWCSEAQRTGDAKTVAACIEATKGLQEGDPFGFKSFGKALVVGAVVFGGVWLASQWARWAYDKRGLTPSRWARKRGEE